MTFRRSARTKALGTAPVWRARSDPRPARLLVTTRMCDHGPLPDGIRASWEAAIPRLEAALGLPAESVPPPLPPRIDEDWFVTAAVEELTAIGRDRARERAGDLTSYLRGVLEAAAEITLDDYLAVRRRRFEATRTIDLLLGTDTVLATPTMCVEGFLADGRATEDAVAPGTDSPAYNTQVANITGHPALSLPAGVSANGVPFGIQLTGPRYADDLLLAAGEAWEAAEPWPLTAPGYDPFAEG